MTYQEPEPRTGVFKENGIWVAYLDSPYPLACGPDEPIIRAAYEWHRKERGMA